MNIDELTLGQIKQIQSMCGQLQKKPEIDGGIRIVILQRGWVVVGHYHQCGHNCWLTNGYVIRRWGTTMGLGEIAKDGPTKDTKLEPTPTMRFHELTVIQTIDCEAAKWEKHCK